MILKVVHAQSYYKYNILTVLVIVVCAVPYLVCGIIREYSGISLELVIVVNANVSSQFLRSCR